MKIAHLLRVLVGGVGFTLAATASSAATLSYQWTLQSGLHSVSGLIEGLIDDSSNQSVTGFSITASTLGGIGEFDITKADKNKDFTVASGIISSGHLKFVDIGDKTVLSPELDFELKWKDGEIDRFIFKSDNGLKNGDWTLDFSKAGVLSSFAPIVVPDPVAPITSLPAVPVPASMPLFLVGIGAFVLLHFRKSNGRSI